MRYTESCSTFFLILILETFVFDMRHRKFPQPPSLSLTHCSHIRTRNCVDRVFFSHADNFCWWLSISLTWWSAQTASSMSSRGSTSTLLQSSRSTSMSLLSSTTSASSRSHRRRRRSTTSLTWVCRRHRQSQRDLRQGMQALRKLQMQNKKLKGGFKSIGT